MIQDLTLNFFIMNVLLTMISLAVMSIGINLSTIGRMFARFGKH